MKHAEFGKGVIILDGIQNRELLELKAQLISGS
jgi:hypothetical protein